MQQQQRGFTLIELTVTTAIVGILAATAYPSFTGPVYKVRRTDAITALMQLQMSQERWRSGHTSYASLAELNTSASSSMRYYALSVTESSETGFSATATGTGAQAADTACRVLRLTVTGGDTRYASGPDENTANSSADNKRCWGV
ncbi:MAG TPA: type IV pilin protein [Rhizobacter sp.]|nr:type IV pilin protein [Rhizobacter sp.]